MSKRIFISRELSDDSPLRNATLGHEVIDRSLLVFSPICFELPDTDWIFFYSRNGVKFFLDQVQMPTKIMVGAIGIKTAEALTDRGIEVDYTGTGDGASSLEGFNKVAKEDSVTFIRAYHSDDRLHRLRGRSQDHSIPVYRNELSSDVPTEGFELLIFTSSRNARAFFKRRTYRGEDCIAIGKPTQDTLSKMGIASDIPTTPDEESLSILVGKWLSER